VEKTASRNGANGEPEAAAIAVIALPSRLDLVFANDLLTSILTRSADPILTLDGSDVDYAATPCVQILLAAGRKRDATNCSLVIRHASDAFRRARDEFGLQPDFSKWMV
jgi:anti-anti-sigma regulatory factor